MKRNKAKQVIASIVLVTALNPLGNICHADLYGALEETSAGWRFSKIQNTTPSSYAVDLNTKSPINYNLNEYNCVTTLWGGGGPQRCTEPEENFRIYSTRYLFTPMMNVLGVILLTPLRYGFVTFKTAHFAQNDYDKAVATAYKSDDINKILQEYETYINSSQTKSIEYNKLAESKISAVYDKYSNIERQFVGSINVSYQTRDLTGFWHSDFELPKLYMHPRSFSREKLTLNPNITIASTPVSFINDLKVLSNNFNAEYNNKMNSLQNAVDGYEAELKNESEKIILPQPTESQTAGFNIKTNYNLISISDSSPNVNVVYTIESKNFDKVFPKYSNNDDNIDVNFDGHKLVTANKKDRFIQINSISIYYNSEVYNMNYERYIELPPETSKDIDTILLLNAPNIEKESRYAGMNRENSQNRKIVFGFAIKYRTSDQTVDKTLYKAPKYDLYKVLSEVAN